MFENLLFASMPKMLEKYYVEDNEECYFRVDDCSVRMEECEKVGDRNQKENLIGLFHTQYYSISNITAATLKLMWDIFMKEVCVCFGFGLEKK